MASYRPVGRLHSIQVHAKGWVNPKICNLVPFLLDSFPKLNPVPTVTIYLISMIIVKRGMFKFNLRRVNSFILLINKVKWSYNIKLSTRSERFKLVLYFTKTINTVILSKFINRRNNPTVVIKMYNYLQPDHNIHNSGRLSLFCNCNGMKLTQLVDARVHWRQRSTL